MKETEIKKLLEEQRTFFASGQTLAVAYRLEALQRLQRAIKGHELANLRRIKAGFGQEQL